MAMLLASSVASAENKQITSPDGKLVVTVADMDGRPSYSVSYDNVLFLKPSPLGMIANIGDFSSGMSLEKNVSTNKIDETYELASIKKSKVRYVANEAVFSFTQLQSPNQKIPDRKTKCVIKTHINIKQNVIFCAKLKPV